jgi:hypothetical protein
MLRYQLRDNATGMWSEGRMRYDGHPMWTDKREKARIWPSIGAMKNHLRSYQRHTLYGHWGQGKKVQEIPESWEIVTMVLSDFPEWNKSARASLPVLTRAEERGGCTEPGVWPKRECKRCCACGTELEKGR